MRLRNDKATECLYGLNGVLDCSGKLGYCIARNNRLLVTELQEYLRARDESIVRHGSGQTIDPSMPGWDAFVAEMADLDAMERDYDFDRISWAEASEQLTARQLLSIDWMLED